MNAEQLRAAQNPLKTLYRNDPDQALATLTAQGWIDAPNQVCRVETHLGVADAGLHPKAGGDGTRACSGDMLLEALVACAGVTLGAVATAMGIHVSAGRIRAEGELDFRGTLGVSREAAVGFKQVTLHFELDCDATDEAKRKLIELTERYCVIYQTLKAPPALSVDVAPDTARATPSSDKPLTETAARELAHEWVEAWNSHDLERILSHYEDDIVLVSPVARERLGERSGTVRGKAALREYFALGLKAFPRLHFELRDVMWGVRSVVLYYRNQRGTMTGEFMELGASGKVSRVVANYSG